MEHLPEKIDSKFRFVLLAAARAEQLMRGARPRVEIDTPKITRLAMEEVLQDRIAWDFGPPPMPEPSEEEQEPSEPEESEEA